ncbi:DNA polymerase III subunit gamma/tau [Extensimonas vulgaris]|uniref:DNA polymerase III subunit gamma/tau n=1 Tax=Extensimonas vulgaris TaxID=1031594 RepID=A0A369ARW8_9BURK|nr:DNA polymerase III subunit gamma/tau [Extensimonas vulgaris]RCX11855.1 DNA polymerase-3 subunit gamma/tau [Extensimonas vulgaris]TWI39054.1 DNA polymerase-3 subunit gamma/tau [Extensimonas vulgaris]TXD15307.1 DNA polymerase III subunit gamma/tau [Extensimonas vulgaris]
MSYVVLARKYRPRNFAEMVGQEHVVQALSNALTQQRLHHAYLFTGTRGVGKTTVSRILAKSLNCQGPDGQGGITASPCGVCAACTAIDSGRFVDYTELDAASNRGVEEVQALLEQAVYKPVQGRFKVFMIDEVHMLTNTAFNAMLKTLEEPPEYLKFVLATTDPQKVPVTVLSRCLQFNLRPMAPETVQSHLVRVLAAENVPAEPQALRLIARAARGSMRDALSLTDQAIAYGSGQLQEAAVRQMLGSVDRSYVFRLIDALAQGDGRAVVETSEALRLHGLSAASTLEEMSAVLQRMAVLQAVPQMAAAVDAQDPEAIETARLAALLPADETQLLYSLCLHGRAELGLAPDEYAALTMVLLRLLAFKPAGGAGGAAHAEKKTLTPPEAAARAPAAAVPMAPPAVQKLEQKEALARIPPAQAATNSGVFEALTQGVAETPADNASTEPAALPDVEQKTPLRQTDKAQAAPAVIAIPVRQMAEPVSSRLQPRVPTASAAVSEAVPTAAPSLASATSNATAAAPAPVVAGARAVAGERGEHGEGGEDGDVWHAAVQQLVASEAISALVRELALQAQLVARDGNHWHLRVEREALNQPTARERLRSALEAAGYASRISVEVGLVTDSPARRNAAAASARQRQAEEIVMGDPYVQTLQREFGAKIVPGSIRPD